jgi:hypothetical protein
MATTTVRGQESNNPLKKRQIMIVWTFAAVAIAMAKIQNPKLAITMGSLLLHNSDMGAIIAVKSVWVHLFLIYVWRAEELRIKVLNFKDNAEDSSRKLNSLDNSKKRRKRYLRLARWHAQTEK